MRAVTQAPLQMTEHGGGRPGEEIAVLVHVQRAEKRDQEGREFHGPSATLTGPGRNGEGDPAGPELFLRLDQERERIVENENALAERGGIGIGRAHAEQPDGNFGSAVAQVAHGGRAAAGETPKTAETFRPRFPASAR